MLSVEHVAKWDNLMRLLRYGWLQFSAKTAPRGHLVFFSLLQSHATSLIYNQKKKLRCHEINIRQCDGVPGNKRKTWIQVKKSVCSIHVHVSGLCLDLSG